MTEPVVDQLMTRAAGAAEAHRWIEAVALYEVVLARAPNHVDAMLKAAGALRANGDHARAVAFLNRAERTEPGRADVALALGEALLSSGRHADAVEAFAAARRAAPLDAGLAARLGRAELRAGNAGAAVAAFETALELDPTDLLARGDLGAALVAAGRPADAVAAFRRDGNPAPRPERAAALFALGDFAGGFAELDAVAMANRPRRLAGLPDWQGETLDGPLLVWCDGDLADLLALSPALPLARSLVPQLKLVLPKPFVRLAGSLRGVDKAFAEEADAGEVLATAPLSGLPARLGLTAGSFVPHAPTLGAEATLVDRWTARLDLGKGPAVIGVTFATASGAPGGLTLADLGPLSGTDHRFVALERLPSTLLTRAEGPSGWEVASAPVRLEHPGPDFDAGVDARVDCAAVISRLDAVIGIDGVPLRLAAALGIPSVALLPPVAAWMFGAAGERSPRLPSLTLLRSVGEAPASLLPAALRSLAGRLIRR